MCQWAAISLSWRPRDRPRSRVPTTRGVSRHPVGLALPDRGAPWSTGNKLHLRTRDSKFVSWDAATWCRIVPLSCAHISGGYAAPGVVPGCSW